MKTLTIEQVETLKNVYWEKENETSFSFIPDVKTFTELTDYDVEEWTEDTQSAELSIKYQTTNITENDIPYFALRFIAKIHGIIWADEYFVMFKGDELGLFTPKTEEQEEQTEEQLFLDTIAGFIGEHDDEYIIDLLKQNCTDFWNKIVCDVAENLTVTDIDDSLKEDIAREWIDDNSGEAFDRAWDNMDSYEIKDKIIDYLSDNL